MTFGSLFAGIGGFDLAFQRNGMRCVWQAEKDANCRSVLRNHHFGVHREIIEDVKHVNKADHISPDVICGGFPCQDLSVAGKRAGLAGDRSGLFFEYMRIVGELVPNWVVIENVPGLLSSNKGRDMATVLGTLEKLGYGTAYRTLDSQYFGVPQRRRRVFIVGCIGADWRSAAKVLFEPESLPWNPPPQRETQQEVAGTLDAGSGQRRGAGQSPGMLTVANALTASNGQRNDPSNDTLLAFDTTNVTSPTNRSNPKPGDPCHTLNSQSHPPAIAYRTTGNDGAYETGDRVGALNCGTDPNQHVIAYQCHGSSVGPAGTLRTNTDSVPFICPTIDASYNDKFGSNQWVDQGHGLLGPGVRRLTPRECERLQGFPDDWTRYRSDGTKLKDSPRYRMLGNAVTVNVAEWIGKRIIESVKVKS